MNGTEITQLIGMYRKHGWTLRRVLLSPRLRAALDAPSLFGETEVRESDLDALWFSRPPSNGEETWELRRLGQPAFAVNEFFDEDDDEEIREETMSETEERLRSANV